MYSLRLETCIFHRGEQHSSRRKRCVCVQVCSSKMYRVHLAVLDRAAQIRPSFPGRTHVVWVHTLSAMHHTRTTQLLGKALTEVISRGSCSQESSVNWCDIQLPRARCLRRGSSFVILRKETCRHCSTNTCVRRTTTVRHTPGFAPALPLSKHWPRYPQALIFQGKIERRKLTEFAVEYRNPNRRRTSRSARDFNSRSRATSLTICRDCQTRHHCTSNTTITYTE